MYVCCVLFLSFSEYLHNKAYKSYTNKGTKSYNMILSHKT